MGEVKYGLRIIENEIDVFELENDLPSDSLSDYFANFKEGDDFETRMIDCDSFLCRCISLSRRHNTFHCPASVIIHDKQLIYGDVLLLKRKEERIIELIYEGLTKDELIIAASSFELIQFDGLIYSKSYNVNEVLSQIK